jgi:hypothetical protein
VPLVITLHNVVSIAIASFIPLVHLIFSLNGLYCNLLFIEFCLAYLLIGYVAFAPPHKVAVLMPLVNVTTDSTY